MSRKKRAVAVGYPHHITQRGNNREPVFWDDYDRNIYLNLLRHYTKKYQVDIWAYCLMSNHVHLLVVPEKEDSLALGLGVANMTYTQHVNRKYRRVGRIWQNRFFSSIVDDDSYLWAVARYIEKNPVIGGLVKYADEYYWSSSKSHLQKKPDSLLAKPSWLDEQERNSYRLFVMEDDKNQAIQIRQATRSGKIICDPEQQEKFESLLS